MTRIIKKRALFFVGVVVTSVVGGLTSFLQTNYSKNESLLSGSLFAETAHADIAPSDASNLCGGDSGGAGGDGGCSDGCY
ncbi:MAG: hypothetical protein WC444_02330 [Candidatus Paceibacterota bacterium]